MGTRPTFLSGPLLKEELCCPHHLAHPPLQPPLTPPASSPWLILAVGGPVPRGPVKSSFREPPDFSSCVQTDSWWMWMLMWVGWDSAEAMSAPFTVTV